jgi:hypothetical protein
MTSGDDKQEEEEFEDIPSEVDGDALEVGNTSAQEKFDKLKKAVKESSKDNDKKSKKENKKKEKEEEKKKEEEEETKKEDNKQEKNKKRKEEEKKRRKRTTSPSSSSSSSSSSSENGDGDDEYYDTRIPKRILKPKPKAKSKNYYKSVSFNYDSLETKSKDDVTIPVGKLPQWCR